MAHRARSRTSAAGLRNPSATGIRKSGNERVSGQSAPQFVSLSQAGPIVGYKLKTLHNWISAGILRREHGLVKVRGRWRVNLARFLEAFQKGELG
jgi:hypothetical protein